MTPRRSKARLLAASLALFTLLSAHAQPQPQAPAQAAPAQAEPTPRLAAVTRADLAQLYLRFERAAARANLAGKRLADVNRGFDAATLQFFSGRFNDVVAQLNTLRLSIESQEPTPAARFAASLKAQIEPAVLVRPAPGQPAPARLVVRALYDAPAAEGVRVKLIDPAGRALISRLVEAVPLDIDFDAADLPLEPGAYRVEISSGGVVAWEARWTVAPRPLAQERAELLRDLAALDPADPAQRQALATLRARINTLQDEPSTTDSAQFLIDPIARLAEVRAETAALKAGRDPYRRHTGDLWRVAALGSLEVPMRVHAPEGAAGDEPRPLLVALHGAGGDESMFMEAYGDGAIRALADRHRLLVASPLTTMVMGNPRVFDAIVDAVALTHAVDRTRIFVLGHSLGAGAAAALAAQRADRLAGVVCIAGGGRFNPGAPLAPTLVIAGELDPLAPAGRLRPGIQRAIDAGLPIEFRERRGEGHTLIVGTSLPEAIDWLLQRPARP